MMSKAKAAKPKTEPKIVLKADQATLQIAADKDGKLRVNASSFEQAVVVLPGQRLELCNEGGQIVATVR